MTHGSQRLSGSSFFAMKVGCGLVLTVPSSLKDRNAGSLVRAASSLTLAPEASAIRKMALLRMKRIDVQ